MVIRAVEYCGRQGIGLRGHRDDGSVFHNDDWNQGNFRELLKLMAEKENNLDTQLKSDSHVPENFAKLKFFPVLLKKNTIICLFGV